MKRRWKILLLASLAVAVLVYVVMPHSGPRRSVDGLKQQLRAKGEKLTKKELAPPASSNGIAAGVAFTNVLADFSFLANAPSAIKMIAPGVGMPGHDIVEAGQMVRYAKNLSQAAELRAVLNSQSIEFDLLDSQGAPIPSLHLSKLKSAAQLLSITSVQALHETNRAEAWSNITAEAEFLRSYRGDPLMISDLVRVATAIIAITATWDALQEDCWTEQQLSELQARWEAVSFTNQLEAVVRMERAFGIASLEEARKMTYQQSAQSFYSSARSRASDGDDPASVVREDLNNLKGRYLFWRWKYSGSFDTEEYNIRSANAALVCSRLILTSGAFLPALHGLDEEATRLEQLDPAAKSSSGIYRYAADMFRRYFERMAAAEAARELVITAIALKRYHLQRSSYPENLNALVPAFLRAVPKDPWDGKSLRYRTLPEGGFVLYSVGKDGEDNGGDATPDHTGNPAAFDFVGKDFLWPRLATPAEVEQYRAKTNRGAAK